MVRRHSVGERVRAARVLGDVTADRASFLARRVGSVVIALPLDRCRDIEIDHAGLHDGVLVFEIDLKNLVHPREGDHQPAFGRNGAAAQAGTGATAHDREFIFGGDLDDANNVLGALGEDDAIGAAFLDAAVILIQHQVLRAMKDRASPNDLAERG